MSAVVPTTAITAAAVRKTAAMTTKARPLAWVEGDDDPARGVRCVEVYILIDGSLANPELL